MVSLKSFCKMQFVDHLLLKYGQCSSSTAEPMAVDGVSCYMRYVCQDALLECYMALLVMYSDGLLILTA
jgi:hypothetical protein